MKRLFLLGIAASLLSLNTGCYVLHGLFGCGTCEPCGFGCGPCVDSCGPCGDSCGPCAASCCCPCEPGPIDLLIRLFDHDCYPGCGCGDVYWGDGCGERCDPCDRCGNYVGRGCGYGPGPGYGPAYGPGPTVAPEGPVVEPEMMEPSVMPAPAMQPVPTTAPPGTSIYRQGRARTSARPIAQAASPRPSYHTGEPRVLSIKDEVVKPATATRTASERPATRATTQPVPRTSSKTQWKPSRPTLQ